MQSFFLWLGLLDRNLHPGYTSIPAFNWIHETMSGSQADGESLPSPSEPDKDFTDDPHAVDQLQLPSPLGQSSHVVMPFRLKYAAIPGRTDSDGHWNLNKDV